MGLLTDLISKVGLDTREFERGLDRVGRKMERKGRRLSLIGNDLTQNISLPLLAMGGYAIKAAADIERLELALKNTMGAGYVDELEKLREVAKDPGLGFEQAVRGSVALQAVGQSAEGARKMMQEWGNAVAAAGGTAHNLDRVIVQLQQALSKNGSLLREDWKFIVQQAPQAQKAMMAVYGTGSTEELAKRGLTAKEVIASITNELSKLGRVEGGIANSFVNFTDSLKQSLAPLGKMIFEASSLQEVMTGTIGIVTKAARAFGTLSPGMQRLLIKFAAGLVVVGPFMRLMGSSILIWAQFYKGIGKGFIQVRRFTDLISDAKKGVGVFESGLNPVQMGLKGMARWATLAAGALAGVGAAAAAALAVVKIRESFASRMGALAADNPNSIWAKIFDADFFTQFGGKSSQKWVEGFVNETINNKKEIQKGIEDAVGLLNKSGVFNNAVSTEGNEIWFKPPKTWADEISEWAKSLQDLNKELRGITEMEKLIGKIQDADRISSIWGQIGEGLQKFGMSADSPSIQNLVGRLKDIRGEVQGIVKEIPKLNLLPKALQPTGGVPSSGANRVGQIQKDQKIWNEQTMYNRGLMAVQALNNGYSEGLISYGEASRALTNEFGLGLGRDLVKGLDNGMVLQGKELMDSLSNIVTDLKITLSSGFSEAIGGIVGGENPLKAFAQGLIIPLTDVLKKFGELMIAAGVARTALSNLAISGVGAVVAGGGLIAASAAVKSFMQNKLTSLADGGIATGPTHAVVGDNPRSPELITPLHKLPGLMRSVMGSGGGPTIRLQGNFEIQGDKLTYFLDEQVDLRKSLSMY